ncbi:MAG: gliding motility-associated C-terminal domain-containing protein [Bacteroidota bacterium]
MHAHKLPIGFIQRAGDAYASLRNPHITQLSSVPQAFILSVLLILLIVTPASSQTNYFQKAIGGNNDDNGYAVHQTTDGGFICAGTTRSFGAGAEDIYLVKTNANGVVLWSKAFGGNARDEGRCVQQTADGGYIITGFTQSYGSGARDVILIKTNSLGTVQWTKTYGAGNDEEGNYVQQTSDLGYLITGYTKSPFGAGAEDIYLVKTDLNGNLQWANAYGGGNKEFGYAAQQTTSGMYIVTGSTESFGAGQEDVFLLKVNGAGNFVSFRTFGGGNRDFGYSIRQISNGKYLIAGSTRSFGAGGDDAFVVNVDSAGAFQWAKTYGGANNDFGYCIRETSSGQFIIAGSTRSFGSGGDDSYLFKTNNTGGLIWSKAYGGGNDEYARFVHQMTNGQYVLLGWTKTFGVGAEDFYLIRTDTVGVSGCNETSPVSIVNTPAVVTGNFSVTVAPGGATNNPVVGVVSADLTTLLCQCIAPPNITGNNTICGGGSTTLTATGGITYSWSTGATTSVVTVTPTITTNYSVLVSNGTCSDTTSILITVTTAPIVTISPLSATICSGGSTTLSASGANTYLWNPGSLSGSGITVSPSVTTTYTVTGTALNGCTNTATVTVTVNPPPSISMSPASASICSGNSTVLTASGGTSYSWAPASGLSCISCSSPTANPTVTTTYTVTGTAASGCTNTATVTVTVNPLPTVTVVPASPAICTGSSVTLTGNGASSYSWSPATGLNCTLCTSPTANPTTTTTYTVVGTDGNGCTNSATVTLTVNPLPVITVIPSSATICSGSSTVLTANGGVSYSWAPATGLSCTTCVNPTASPLFTTTYTVTGTAASGCTSTATVTVTVNPSPTVSVVPASGAICAGGSVNLTANGANSYSWAPASGLSCTTCQAPTANPTVTTSYTVIGTAGNGCTNAATVTVSVNPLPSVSVAPASATICTGASVTLTGNGASSYSWSPSTGLSCTFCPSPTASPTANTTYTVVGTDANGCTNTATVAVTVSPLPSVSASPPTVTVCVGVSVNLSASGANSYSWFPATALSCVSCQNPTANPTSTTTYTVIGTDINGCTNTATVTITVNPLPSVSVTPASPAICTGSQVILTGNGANSYSWSPSTTLSCTLCQSPTANPTTTTTYTVTGTSISGCTNISTITVTVNPLPSISITPSSASICVGSSVILTGNGASSYSWAPASGLSCTTCQNPTASPTSTTTYTLIGTDANGCTNSSTVTVTVNPLPVVSIAPASSVICLGSSVNMTASGANSYSWSPATGLSCVFCQNPTANPTATTTYTVTGTSINGCTNTATVTITVNPLPGISISPASSVICSGASVTLSASGGSSYSWSPVTGLSCSLCQNPTANPTVTTTYTVTGTNNNGCTNTATVTVTVNPLPVINIAPSSAAICSGGSVTLTASGANTYSWSPATALSCVTCQNPTANPTATTIYTVTGADLNGCSGSSTVTVTVNPLPAVSVVPSSASICVGASLMLSANGANSYLWSPSTGLSCTFCQNPSATPTVTTTYTVIGTDVNGCTNSATVTITVNPLPAVSVVPASSTICSGGSTSLTANGANSYSWSPAMGLSCIFCQTPTANPSVTTTYTVTGTSLNGCTNTTTATVTVNPLPPVTISPASVSICDGGSAIVTAGGAANYSWSPSSGLSCTTCQNPSANPTITTTYTVTGTDANGCTNTATVTVTVNPLPNVTIAPVSATICSGNSVTLTASGANSYSWSPATGLSCSLCQNPVANPTVTTTYTVTGASSSGCTNTSTITVTVNPLPSVNVIPAASTICSGASVSLSANGASSYSWSPATGLSCTLCPNPTANPTITTVYTVTGTGSNGCTSSTTVIITVNPLPSVSVFPASPSICSGSTVNLTAGGAASYSWSPGTGLNCTLCQSPAANPLVTTTYTVTGTDANGCTNTATVTVTVNPLPIVNVIPGSTIICAGTSVNLMANGATTYNWSPSIGLSCTTCQNPTASPVNTTTYTVVGTDNSGCTNSATVSVTVLPAPVITVNPPSSVYCLGGSVNLSANGANTYSWSPATGLSCTLCPNPLANPVSTTTYTVVGSASNGCTNTTTITVTVNSPPSISILPGSTAICSGSSISLIANGANSYSWSPAAGLSCTTCQSPTASPSATTTYTVTGTDINGCTNTSTITITVNPLPSVTITPSSASICSGSSVTLSASGANTYNWSPGTGLSCTTCQNPIASPTATATYSVVGVDANGCTNTASASLTVNPLPIVSATPATTTICIGGSTPLLASGANTYSWSPATGLSCALCQNPTANPTITTVYTVTGTDVNGCSNTAVITVNVTQPPVAGILADTVICSGDFTILTATGGTSFLWNTGDTTPTITVNPSVITTYSVIVSNAGCSSSSSVTISVNPSPVSNAGADATIIYGSSTTLAGSGGGTFSWSPSNNLSCISCPNPVASPTTTTTYYLTVTNSLGCSSTDTVTVFVDVTCGEVFVANVFSPNNDGANDVLYVQNNCIKFLTFVIYDRWGEKVFETDDPNQGWDGTFKGEKLNPGAFVYYVRARLVNEQEIIQKGNVLLIK